MATWKIDTSHSHAEFSVRHMMISKVRGVFEDLSGELEFDAASPENSSVKAIIKTASVNTRENDRDAHLRSSDFFDIEAYPDMIFESTNINVTGNNTAQIIGNLTIKDVTKQVTFDVEHFGETPSPFGDTRIGFSGNTQINREDWGLTWNMVLETGGVLVSKEVTINVELQAIKVTEEEAAPA